MSEFKHQALDLKEEKVLIFTALSKHIFYFRVHICKFVIEQHKVPANPFMMFDYFLSDTVDRDLVREANNNMVLRSDELWVFGEISNGVLAEIKLAREADKPIKFFKIEKPHNIVEIEKNEVIMEKGMENYKNEI